MLYFCKLKLIAKIIIIEPKFQNAFSNLNLNYIIKIESIIIKSFNLIIHFFSKKKIFFFG